MVEIHEYALYANTGLKTKALSETEFRLGQINFYPRCSNREHKKDGTLFLTYSEQTRTRISSKNNNAKALARAKDLWV